MVFPTQGTTASPVSDGRLLYKGEIKDTSKQIEVDSPLVSPLTHADLYSASIRYPSFMLLVTYLLCLLFRSKGSIRQHSFLSSQL